MLFEAVLVLLIIALLSLLCVALSSPRGGEGWMVEGVVTAPDYYINDWAHAGNMFPGDDGTLYTFDGYAVHAISRGGRLLWSCDVPAVLPVSEGGKVYNLSLTGYGDVLSAPSAAVRDGNLYIIVGSGTHVGSHGALLAISPQGELMWQVPFLQPDRFSRLGAYSYNYPVDVQVNGDVIMVFSLPSGLTLISPNGTVLKKIDDIISMPAVDDEGIFYARNGTIELPDWYALYANSSIGAYYPDGKVKWRKSYTSLGINDTMAIVELSDLPQPYYRNGTVYVWSDDGVAALDRSGALLWSRHIEGDRIVGYGFDRNGTLYLSYVIFNYTRPDLSPSGIVFISPDGRIAGNTPDVNALPLQAYNAWTVPYNGTGLTFTSDLILAFDNDYRKLWELRLDGAKILGYGFDRNGTLYAGYTGYTPGKKYIEAPGFMTITPDGSVIDNRKSGIIPFNAGRADSAPEGIYYSVTWDLPGVRIADPAASDVYPGFDVRSVIEYLKAHGGKWENASGGYTDLWRPVVHAYDLNTGSVLWNRSLAQVPMEAVLTPDNAGRITVERQAIEDNNAMSLEAWYAVNGIPAGSKGFTRTPLSDVLVTDDLIYVNVWSYNCEVPAFYNRSRCIFAGGIYALAPNGTVLWLRATDSRVFGLEERNGTLFYGSGDGKVTAIPAGVAGGAVIAVSYLFFRFFLAGAVARTRARLGQNANRNRVLKYVKENPGVSMFEMSQSLGMNIGTVRYHLLILGMNHRITAYRADEKYVRYFTNAGSYSPRDQLVISLMKREPLRKILITLREKPGLTNLELSRELDAHESSTMRNVKELMKKGLVVKSLMSDGKIAYYLDSEFREQAMSAARLLKE
jgi:predicted transcriptional regulator